MPKLKKAVILFNLGGPDSLDAVKPFLFNLFNDKAILKLPQPFRFFLALFISSRRAQYSREIYQKMGGKSPIIALTNAQAKALERALNEKAQDTYKVFFTMRYWIPFAQDVVEEVKIFNPDEVILLPLYPQFSTTTTDSSIKNWHKLAKNQGLKTKTKAVCCYPDNQGFIDAYAKLTKIKYEQAKQFGDPIVLFSAHGIPLNRVKDGDPYEWQVIKTAGRIVSELNIDKLSYVVCYQSKVGSLEWLSPATDREVIHASQLKKSIVVVPLTFVSEHAETLVELDITYKELANKHGCPAYYRVEAVGTHPDFIHGLRDLCLNYESISNEKGKSICPVSFTNCLCRETRAYTNSPC